MTPHINAAEIMPEFSRIVLVSDLTSTPKIMQLEANPQECKALAKRFDIVDIHYLRIEASIWRKMDTGIICFKGVIRSKVVQSCVVSFAPVTTKIEVEFKEFFEEGIPHPMKEEEEIIMDLSMLEDEESPEMITGNNLDIGEIIAQNLSLSLDDYPRAKDADLSNLIEKPQGGALSPFAGLSEKLNLKK